MKRAAETILTQARIYGLLSPHHPPAQALAIAQGVIIEIGPEQQVMRWADSQTRVIPCGGATLLPGFVESHGHLHQMGKIHLEINLTGKSYAETLEQVKKAAVNLKPGEWIIGRGWDENLWEEDAPQRLHRSLLDPWTPQNPVSLTRVDGHCLWTNSYGLEVAKLDRHTADPKGGKLERDDDGGPSGLLIDTAMEWIWKVLPTPDQNFHQRSIAAGIEESLSRGITSFHDASTYPYAWEIYRQLRDQDQLPLRLNCMASSEDKSFLQEVLERGPQIQSLNNHLGMRSVKFFADGALGSCGAHLLEAYHDSPDQFGLEILGEDELTHWSQTCFEKGFQVCTHAIGDRANRQVLNAYERALEEWSNRRPNHHFRPRVEHAQLIHPDDLPRFAKNNIVASMQPTHCTSDMVWTDQRLGRERTDEEMGHWKTLIDSGAHLAAGSDAPIENVNPFWGLYAFLTRQTHQQWPPQGQNPQQRLDLFSALKCFTYEGAYANFQEHSLGVLEKGRWADFIFCDRDPFQQTPQQLLQTQILQTWVGGKCVYQKKKLLRPKWPP